MICTLYYIGNASINNNTMVAVIVRALQCGVQYTITAGGMFDNGTLVGPAMSHKSTITSPCPPATGERLFHMYICSNQDHLINIPFHICTYM